MNVARVYEVLLWRSQKILNLLKCCLVHQRRHLLLSGQHNAVLCFNTDGSAAGIDGIQRILNLHQLAGGAEGGQRKRIRAFSHCVVWKQKKRERDRNTKTKRRSERDDVSKPKEIIENYFKMTN